MIELDHTRPDPDLSKGHPLLQERWSWLEVELKEDYGLKTRVNEVYRPELRQQWLFGQGRTVGELQKYGISFSFARPKMPRVTNAWSAKVSAHGCTRRDPATGLVVPAAAALDVVPVGADGRPWTADDPWDAFLAAIAAIGRKCGLVHFHSRGKQVTDKPHLQLWPEWSDKAHRLTLLEN